MLVVNRFLVPDGPAAAEFEQKAAAALEALSTRPGYVRGGLGRAYDDPAHWTMVTEWDSVGAYRRALGSFDVKVHAIPLLAQSLDEPSAYEELVAVAGGGQIVQTDSDRASTDDRPINSRS